MKYLVISTRKKNAFGAFASNDEFTILAETKAIGYAERLQRYYNATDNGQICEIHPVMEDKEIQEFLDKYEL